MIKYFLWRIGRGGEKKKYISAQPFYKIKRNQETVQCKKYPQQVYCILKEKNKPELFYLQLRWLCSVHFTAETLRCCTVRMFSLDGMVYIDCSHRAKPFAETLNQWDTYDLQRARDLWSHRYIPTLMEFTLGLPWKAAKPRRSRWKSNKQRMVHMKVFTGPYSAPHSFFLFFPPFCMSCHLEGCVSSVVLASWRKDPSSSCSGERDYSNPTPPVRLTIIIIIISPKRSIICSHAAAAVLNGRLINPIGFYFGVCFWFCLLESQRGKEKKWLSLDVWPQPANKKGEKNEDEWRNENERWEGRHEASVGLPREGWEEEESLKVSFLPRQRSNYSFISFQCAFSPPSHADCWRCARAERLAFQLDGRWKLAWVKVDTQTVG